MSDTEQAEFRQRLQTWDGFKSQLDECVARRRSLLDPTILGEVMDEMAEARHAVARVAERLATMPAK